DLAVDPETRIGPAANPFTVVQIGPLGGAVARVGLVIAAARAHRTRPARRAVGLVRDVMRVEERRLFRAVDARVHVAKLVVVRAGEPVTQRDVAGRRHTEQAESCAARPRLARALVNLAERLVDVAEAVMTAGERGVAVVGRQIAELREDLVEAVLAERMRT